MRFRGTPLFLCHRFCGGRLPKSFLFSCSRQQVLPFRTNESFCSPISTPMKHLSGLHQTFPHLPSRAAIMGIVQKKKTPVEMAEEEIEVKQRSSQFVTVKVFFTVRPHLAPCHCAVVSVPLGARCSELLETSWGLFLEYREKMGSFLGPAPSESMDDYMMCFMNQMATPTGYRALVSDIRSNVQLATQERRRSSVLPGALASGGNTPPGPNNINLQADAKPLSMDQLMGSGPIPDAVSASTSPAASAFDPPRRRSRSASVLSTSTIVTVEMIDGEEPERDIDDDDDDDLLSGQHGEVADGGPKVPSNILDVASSEFKHLNRVSQLITRMLPKPQMVCEECPPSAIVSRLVANRLKKRQEGAGNATVVSAQTDGNRPMQDVDDGLVSIHLVLKYAFQEREVVILTEEKTRLVVARAFELSWDAMKNFEDQCREQTKVFEVRRAVEVEQIRSFEDREHTIRTKHLRMEHSTWADAIHAFKTRYNDLEVGMIAQYRQMRMLHQQYHDTLRDMGFESVDEA